MTSLTQTVVGKDKNQIRSQLRVLRYYHQRCNVNVTMFGGFIVPWMGIDKLNFDKWRGIDSLRIFSKPSAMNGFGFCLYQLPFVLDQSYCFPQYDEVVEDLVWAQKPNVPLPFSRFIGVRLKLSRTQFGLKSQTYLYLLAILQAYG